MIPDALAARDTYSQLKMPVAIIAGAEDRLVDAEDQSARLHGDIPLSVGDVAEAVAAGEFERGIVLGGSGNGEAMTANRVKGIRCGLCWNLESARLTRRHNDANVLSLGERMMDLETALQIVDLFLSTPFEGGRHLTRIQQLDA